MRKALLVLVGLSLACAAQVSAQYNSLLQPLSREEIQHYQKLGIKEQFQYVLENGQPKLVSYRRFSPEGYLLTEQTDDKRRYFNYDDRGLTNVLLDSQKNIVNWQVNKYEIAYDQYKKPLFMKKPENVISSFSYNPERGVLLEQFTKEDLTYRRWYIYNMQNQLEIELHHLPQGKPETAIKRTYDSIGRLLQRVELRYLPEQKIDSIREVRTYENGRLANIVTITCHLGKNELPGEKVKKGVVVEERTEFQYDANGNLLQERFFSPLADKSYRIEYAYDEKGRIITEVQYDARNNQAGVIEYKYTFHSGQ